MTNYLFLVILAFISLATVKPQDSLKNEETAAIQAVLVDAYVRGVFIERDEKLVKHGFHPGFTMQVLNGEEMIQASLDMWLDRLKLEGQKNSNKIEHKFKFIDVVGRAAVAKMEIFENSKHLYTDYFSLYRFQGGWKIVSKVFNAQD
jgi:hypothetical protein